nr:substrate-binding domain-containing protein [Hymenobacter citatus]
MVPTLTGTFFPEVLHTISTAATRAKLRVIICEADESEQQEQQLHWLLTAQVDGLLVCATNPAGSAGHFQLARQRGVPLVFFHQAGPGKDVHAVVLNQVQAAYKAVSHLLAQGRTRIAHFAGPAHQAASHDHRQGYAQALCEYNVPWNERLLYEGEATVEAGRRHLQAALASGVLPDALFISNEVVALGALQVLHERGVRVPETIALVVCGGTGLAALASPPLTSLDLPGRELGHAAVQLLLALLADPGGACQRIYLTPQLHVRASSAAGS